VRIPSERARGLIEALEATRRFPSQIVPIGAAHRASLFDELAQLGEVAAVPALVGFTLEHGERNAASRALRRLLSDLPCDAHLDLEHWARDLGEWRTPLGRTAMADVGRLEDAGLLGLLTSHGSGYVREAALRKLVRVDPDFAWPFLLLRINDWVAPIRARALEFAESQLPRLPQEKLVKYLPLVERLKHVGRAEPSGLLRQFDARLATPEGLAALESGLAILPLRSRRAAYVRLLAQPEVSAPFLLRALAENDPPVSLAAAARSWEVLQGAELEPFVQSLERSRLPTVRREAYVAYANRLPAIADTKLRVALLDPSEAVRDFARVRLQGLNLATFYRESLAAATLRPGALLGLGEVGNKDDVERLRPFFKDARPRIRRAALRAAVLLDVRSIAPELRDAFGESSPALTRVAAAGLALIGETIDLEWLAGWLDPERARHHVRAATQLVLSLNPWDALALIVRCAGKPDPFLSRWVQTSLRSWLIEYNRRFAPPLPAQMDSIEALLKRVALPSPFDRELPHLLAAWRR
jgi:hypothetical protein